jgi:hypothetical protein
MQLHGSAPGHKSLLTGELGFAAFCMMLENAQGVKKAIARIMPWVILESLNGLTVSLYTENSFRSGKLWFRFLQPARSAGIMA